MSRQKATLHLEMQALIRLEFVSLCAMIDASTADRDAIGQRPAGPPDHGSGEERDASRRKEKGTHNSTQTRSMVLRDHSEASRGLS